VCRSRRRKPRSVPSKALGPGVDEQPDPRAESGSVDAFGRAESFGNGVDAIDLCAGHEGFAAPDQPDAQITLVAVLLQLSHIGGVVADEQVGEDVT